VSESTTTGPRVGSETVWHDAECGSYGGDLAIWEEIAAARPGPILDLGAGTGRVALHLGARGHEVVAVEADPELAATLATRASERGLPVSVECADAREFERAGAFGLIVAPMQFVHLLGGPEGRRAMLGAALRSLRPGGELNVALLEHPLPPLGEPGPEEPTPLPDVREVDGWLHSSLPTAIRISDRWVAIERLRQLVSPRGELSESTETVTLDRVTPDEFEAEAVAQGFRPVERLEIAETERHVGSLVVRLGRPG